MLTILVVSDFHARFGGKRTSDGSPEASYYTIRPNEKGIDVPGDFLRYIDLHKIKADIVICCGDIIEKTDVKALNEAWAFAHRIQQSVGGKHLIISTGNHDVDSRGKTNVRSANENLKKLSPQYPSHDDHEYEQYWSRNYFIRDIDDAQFVVINTCSSHGYKKNEKFGIFSAETEHLLGVLKSKAPKLINICVCHHHPHRHGEHGLGDHDDMKNGQVLLDTFSRHDCGQWLIVHGHKHHPKLSYAQGNSFSPIVFSAGSLSARLYDQLGQNARNQFHLIKLDPAEMRKYRRLVGTYSSWSWFPGSGWREAGHAEGLPANGGFGFRDVAALLDLVRTQLRRGRTSWADVLKQFEAIQYLIPSDLEYFLNALRSDGIKAEYDESLGKKSLINLIREN